MLKVVFSFLVSVNDTRNPTKPVHTSVIKKPIKDTTNMSWLSTPGKSAGEVKIAMAVSSRVPSPAKVIGMKPAAFAIGKNNKKEK